MEFAKAKKNKRDVFMETIITKSLEVLKQEMLVFFAGEDVSIDNAEERLTERVRRTVCEIMGAYYEKRDRELREDKEFRQAVGLQVERRNEPRSVLTKFGEVSYRRTYYEGREGYCYPIDEIARVDSRQRISRGVSQELVERTIDFSYDKSRKIVTKGAVSKQTVMNKIRQSQVPETERYTKEQIDSMIVEQNRLIREYRIAVSQAELDWKKAGQTASDGVVRADHDGIVVSVGSIYSGKSDEPLISVSSGNGYQIMSTLTELQLGTVKVGDEISVSMWSNGQTYPGRIVRISPYPTGDNMGYSYNPNPSNYIFIADLECEDELQPWDGGEIQFLSDQQGSKGMFALEACFVREEGGRNYVLKAGDDGRLEKQYVEVGRILYGGWSVEIISGLGMEDYIAFPYGKNAVEGARADYESGVMAW